jgi:hypothetical protein
MGCFNAALFSDLFSDLFGTDEDEILVANHPLALTVKVPCPVPRTRATSETATVTPASSSTVALPDSLRARYESSAVPVPVTSLVTSAGPGRR